MSKILILLVEDEPEVRQAVERDLEAFTSIFALEATEDAADAINVIREYLERGYQLGLILADHLMPGTTGVDLLVDLDSQERTATARKVLLTGQASHADTIRAVNQAGLDHYIAKPWTPEDLQDVVRQQLTDYVLDEVDDLLPYIQHLDSKRLLEAIGGRSYDR